MSAATRTRTSVAILLVAGTAAAVACVVALLVAGGRPTHVSLGLPDAGQGVGWALRVAGLLVNLAAVLTVGSLLVAAVLVPARPGVELAPEVRRAVRASGRWALAWAVLSLVLWILTIADTIGVPLDALTPGLVERVGVTGPFVPNLVVAGLAVVVVAGSARATTVRGARLLLGLALAGLVPTVLTGHTSSASDHEVAATGLLVHVVSAAIWAGGVAGLALHLRDSPGLLSPAVRRFSGLALCAYVALGVSGLLTATTRVAISPSRWTSSYGAVVAAKVAVFVVLGILGQLHRRRTIAAIAEGHRRPFFRLVGIEIVAMGVAMGLAAALARTPPPAVEREPAHGSGHSTLPSAVDPFSFSQLVTSWRPDAVVLLVLALAIGGYVSGVRALARHDRRWPAARTGVFVAAVVVAAIDLCSGVATYAPAMVSVQIAQLLVALLLVPGLVTVAAPLTLRREVRAARGLRGPAATAPPPTVLDTVAARALTNPTLGAVAVSAVLLVVYRSPLIELSLRSTWVHLLVLVLAAVAGLMLLCPVLGVDRCPVDGRPPAGVLTRVAERAGSVAAVVGCLSILAAQLRYGDRLVAGRWFLELRWGWVDPAADQHAGAAILAVTAGAMAALILVPVYALAAASVGRRLQRAAGASAR